MSLLAEIKATRKPHTLCTVAIVLPTLTKEDADDLIEAIADPTVYATTISATLAKLRDVVLTADTIQRHRRGGCTCDSPKA